MNKVIAVFTKESFLVPLVAIILGLLTGAVAMLAGGFNPVKAYVALLEKVFGSAYNFGETIRQITPLIFTGLAVAFAFRTGLFNIGAEGQFIVGMLASTAVGVSFDLPAYIHAPLAIIAGAVAGGLWGSIAGYLKAARGVNEVITSIMLNWVALYFANWVLNAFYIPAGQQRSEMVKDSAVITIDWLSAMFDSARLHWGTLVAILAAIFFYVILWKTKSGYELRAVGLNPHASEYAGMNVNRNVVKAMFIGGMFAGIGGACEILGVFHYQAIMTAQPGYGFDGIAVALIGGNTPLGVVLAAILFGILTFGSAGMKFGAGVPVELIRVVIASVIFFVAAHGIVKIFVKPILKKKKEGGN
ncbi:ABC transporter permease [Brevibacillus reuszeri]|uniref:ABC transporter permease n=1 Tax=Brevibacillus reuszeri TaxID=54915 RepID=A0A0K9YVQ8_9BACL|nr:ABC transporter permease [Brevibacillus reuszeri]KNB72794.1 branched-chain amino acid ABC transporter permease [Brevibacillus reuszeri]MED1860501.1 ABC transporter permease [Brevibacillus reuszeri]GED70170.1 ABC transporter permease [Brevibacillus reuszeri]